jgi:hypothetical protein
VKSFCIILKKTSKVLKYAYTGKATGKESIPYKNWSIQNKYLVHGWPSEVEFVDYTKLSESDKVKVLSALNNINFSENQNTCSES